MAFPSSSGTKKDDAANAWNFLRAIAAQVKASAQSVVNESAAGPISAVRILEFSSNLASNRTQLARWAGVPGVAEYAKSVSGDPTLDIVAEYTLMFAQTDPTLAGSCAKWIIDNFPKDGSNNLLAAKFAADGTVSYNTFTTVQTAGLRTALGTLIATID